MTKISRLEFQDHIEEILVPTEKVIQIRNGKKINKEKVYFPGFFCSTEGYYACIGSEIHN